MSKLLWKTVITPAPLYMTAETSPLIELENIVKEFPGVRALDGVSFSVRRGEIHALVGENGAGKSTLINILSGIWPSGTYDGQLKLKNRPTAFVSIANARDNGIAVIHQELALVDELTVAENIFLAEEPAHWGLIDESKLQARAQAILNKLQLSLDIHERVEALGTGSRQMVEIAKAFARQFEVLILDEPTAALSQTETQHLLNFLQSLKSEIGIVYISHHIPEVLTIADRITVLRDGKSIATHTRTVTEHTLIDQMVGRKIEQVFPKREYTPSAERLRVQSTQISFSAGRGEILGIAGLVGSGRTRLLESIYGLKDKTSVWLDGVRLKLTHPQEALAAGIAYLSEDRRGKGLHLDLNIQTNITLSNLKNYCQMGVVLKNEQQAAQAVAQDLAVKAPHLKFRAGNLSGGNQQKVALAKSLLCEPKVLLLDEPTRGIDVGAKQEIYALIGRLAAQGRTVIVVSSELIELLGLCDRILTLAKGKLTGEFMRKEASETTLMQAMVPTQ